MINKLKICDYWKKVKRYFITLCCVIIVLLLSGCSTINNELLNDDLYIDYIKKLDIYIRNFQYLTKNDIKNIENFVEKNYIDNKDSVDFQNDEDIYIKLCRKVWEKVEILNEKNKKKGIMPNYAEHTIQYYMYKKYYGDVNLIDDDTIMENKKLDVNIDDFINTKEYELYKEYLIDELIQKTGESSGDNGIPFWERESDAEQDYIEFYFVDINDDGMMEFIPYYVGVNRQEEMKQYTYPNGLKIFTPVRYNNDSSKNNMYTIYDGKVKRLHLKNYLIDSSDYSVSSRFIQNYIIEEHYNNNIDSDSYVFKKIIDGEIVPIEEVYIPNQYAITQESDSCYRFFGGDIGTKKIITEDEAYAVLGKYRDIKNVKEPIVIRLKQLKFDRSLN